MYLTVRDALDELLRFAGELGDTEARKLGLSLLNDALYDVWMAHAWLDYQSPAPFELTMTAGRSRYALPNHVGRLLEPVVNRSRPGAPLAAIDASIAAELYPGMGTSTPPSGPAKAYRLSGVTGVLRQPAITGDVLEVVSDSASDINVLVTVRGDDATGAQRTKRVTLTGQAPVTLGTFSFVDEFAKATVNTVTPAAGQSSAGTVSLRRASDGVVLQALDAFEAAREHKVLQIYPTPDAPDVLAIPFMRRPQPLVADSDSLPGDWWKAIKEAWEIAYRVNTGELAVDSQVARPHLRKMIEDDNLLRPRPTKTPYSGGGYGA